MSVLSSTTMRTPRHQLSPAAALLAMVFALVASAAQAACRSGSGPDLGDGIPYCWELEEGAAPAPYPMPYDDGAPLLMPEPPAEWADRWGAIALGGGGFGAASGLKTEREASELAKAKCLQSSQGKGCDEVAVYYNQCVAAAAGSNDLTIASLSPELAYAKQLALAACSKEAQSCKVFYAACSNQVRIGR